MQFVVGGAIHLDCSSDYEKSLVCFDERTKIYMANNTALKNGGAIVARENCLVTPACGFNGREACQKIILENNTARVKGYSIYVTAVDIQTWVLPSTFWSIFTIHSVNHPLEIAAPSYKICLCSELNAGLLPEWMEEDNCPQKDSVQFT